MSSPLQPVFQVSLDVASIQEALDIAAMALRAGVDWLEAGTPLILAEGLHGVCALRDPFPGVPLVADLKTMDGGYLEAEMMAEAGATYVVVMTHAQQETVCRVVEAGEGKGHAVAGDNLDSPEKVDAAKTQQALGYD